MNKDYKYALSLTSQFYFCGVPFRFDVSPKCSLGCKYCFSMNRGGKRTLKNQVANTAFYQKKIINSIKKFGNNFDINSELLNNRLPIHFGGMSDPFQDKETTIISKNILEAFAQCDYPIIISTKNVEALIDSDLLSILKTIKHLIVQISVITSNERYSEKLEPFASTVLKRMECIKLLTQENINTTVRLQPLIYPWLEEIINNFIPSISEAGCKHVIVEHLKLPVERRSSHFDSILKEINWNAYEFYFSKSAKLIGREWILPPNFMWFNIQNLIEQIRKNGMTYGSGDYGLYHLGDTDCCCGVDKISGFENWNKANFSNIIKHCDGEIYFNSILNYWIPSKSIKRVVNSNCRQKNKFSMLEYLKIKWNMPGTANAPDSYLGINWTGDYDSDGNCIYEKN